MKRPPAPSGAGRLMMNWKLTSDPGTSVLPPHGGHVLTTQMLLIR